MSTRTGSLVVGGDKKKKRRSGAAMQVSGRARSSCPRDGRAPGCQALRLKISVSLSLLWS